jgi:hypothetical protein
VNEFDALVEGFDGLTADEKELLAGQIKASAHLAAPEPVTSHGMTVNDQSTADAFDEILGAPSSVGERRDDDAEVPGSTPGGLIVERVQDVVEMTKQAWAEHDALDEPPFDPMDWPEDNLPSPATENPMIEPPAEDVDTVPPADLRVLRADQRPKIGVHYVIYDGIPRPVIRDSFSSTEDEFVRSQIDESDTLKDHDGQRKVRADRALRMRYRGYVCGEMSSL